MSIREDTAQRYTLEAHLARSGTLKKVLEAIKDLLVQATFNCDEDGMHMEAMDSSHVTLVSLTLNNDRFENYRCDRAFGMGMKLASFSKIVKCASDNDAITMKANANSDTITFVIERSDQNKVSVFEMRLMNLDYEHLTIPDSAFACNVRLPSAEYNRICNNLSNFGDTVAISCSSNAITFKTSGDIGSGYIRLKHTGTEEIGNEQEAVIIHAQEPVTLSFSCKYLQYFSKAWQLTPQVQISMAADQPVRVEYLFPELGQMRYYLAPKIDEEDD